jgi:hypothetical protein
MSNFTTPADQRLVGNQFFKLIAPFEYHVGSLPSDHVIRVPARFVTDLASVLRAIWPIMPLHGRYAKAAIIYDCLYTTGQVLRLKADNVFLEAIKVLGVPMWKLNCQPWFGLWSKP